MFERALFVLVLSSSSLSLAPLLSLHCLPVLCPAHQLPQCRIRRLKPLHSRSLRSIAPCRCTTFSQGRQVRVLVHGDDFVTAADMAGLQWMKVILDEHLETKHQVPRSDPWIKHEIVFLNRTIRWENNRIVYAADRRHADQIVKAMGGGGRGRVEGSSLVYTADL